MLSLFGCSKEYPKSMTLVIGFSSNAEVIEDKNIVRRIYDIVSTGSYIEVNDKEDINIDYSKCYNIHFSNNDGYYRINIDGSIYLGKDEKFYKANFKCNFEDLVILLKK
jgi:hypothetical protein